MTAKDRPPLHGAASWDDGPAHPVRDCLEVLVASPLRDLGCMATVPRLGRLGAELCLRYLLRFPALFVPLDRRAIAARDAADDSFLFGETPFHTARDLCRRVRLRADDVLLDAGCGRGKMVFFAHLCSGCRSLGVDALGTYVRVASAIARRMGLSGVRFEQQDMRSVDLSAVTVLYVHGPNFSDAVWAGLVGRLDALPQGARCIVVGRRCEHPRLRLEGEERQTFSWGMSTVRYYGVADP